MKSIHNEHSYVTVTWTEAHQGKLFESNWREKDFDPSNPKINKSTPFATGNAVAKTVRVENVKALESLLNEVSQDPNQAIVLGFAKGTEPDDSTDTGEMYQLVSQKKFADIFPQQKPPYKNPTRNKQDKILYACRTKQMFNRSSWMGFDLDMSPHMPPALQQLIATNPYMDLLCELCPQLRNVSYLTVQSSSSRVEYKGERMSAANTHIYMQCEFPTDLDRFSAAMLLKSVGTKFGYTHPVLDPDTGLVIPDRRGVPSSIFDRSVFSKGRVMFEGAPQLNPQDPEVINGNLKVHPNAVQSFTLGSDYVNTHIYANPTMEEQAKARIYMEGGGTSFTLKNMTDLTPDISIEVKNPDGTDERVITMQDFVDGEDTRLRCQNPFKRESRSWSAFLSKADYEGNPIDPYLSSQEFGNFYFNPALELFSKIQTTGEIAPPPPPNTAVNVHVNVPPPPVKDTNRYALSTEVKMANAQRVNINNPYIETPPLPDEASDDVLAERVNRYFCEPDGTSNILSAGLGREWDHSWNGLHWEPVPPTSMESWITKCAAAGSVKKMTATKISSVARLSRLMNMTPGEVEHLPSYMVLPKLFGCTPVLFY